MDVYFLINTFRDAKEIASASWCVYVFALLPSERWWNICLILKFFANPLCGVRETERETHTYERRFLRKVISALVTHQTEKALRTGPLISATAILRLTMRAADNKHTLSTAAMAAMSLTYIPIIIGRCAKKKQSTRGGNILINEFSFLWSCAHTSVLKSHDAFFSFF